MLAITVVAGFALSAQSVRTQTPQQVAVGEPFTVTFSVTGGNAQAMPRPLQLPNCVYRYGPAVSSVTQMQIVNGQQSVYSRNDYTYTYIAEKAGSCKIPSFEITVGGKTLRTESRTINILPQGRNARQSESRQQQQQQQSRNEAPVQGSGKKVTSDDIFIEVQLSKSKLYQQEAVIATIKAYTLYEAQLVSTPVLPAFDGFLSEELPVATTAKREHYRGENYWSCELKKCLLFPQKSGTLSINSGSFDLKVVTYHVVSNGYIPVQVPTEHFITTKTRKVNVNVLPLPQPQPAGFFGAVGKFSVNTSLEPQLLHTNEAATYKIVVSGTGNVKYMNSPELDLGTQAEVYNPESENNAKFNGSTLQGSFTTTYTIVPQKVGELEIEAAPFVYFDPSAGKYVTVEMPAIKRKVLQGSAPVVADNVISNDMTDILHIKQLGKDKGDVGPERVYGSWYYVLCYILLIIGAAATVYAYRRHLKVEADVVGRKNARANRVAVKRLRYAAADMKTGNAEAFYAHLSSALWGYVSDKLNIPASALTRDNITEKLQAYGAAPAVIDRTIEVLDRCEMARFTPDMGQNDMPGIYADASNIINDLENGKNK